MLSYTILYNADESGYRVLVSCEGRVIDEYAAGSNPHDSQAPADPGYPAVPRKTLLGWARRTALELAEETLVRKGGPQRNVQVARDPDILI